MKINYQIKKDQSGMASFLVVTIIVALLSLVSIGFSRLADREAHQALDRQLSDVAYYAAESGLNDAKAYLSSTSDYSTLTSSCQQTDSAFAFNGNVDGTTSGNGAVRYTCLRIDTTVKELSYPVAAWQTVAFPITSNDLGKLYFSWENSAAPSGGSRLELGNPFKTLPIESSLSSSDYTGLLRVGIYPVPTTNITGDTKADITSASRVFFLYPKSGNGNASTIHYDTRPNGDFADGQCKSTHPVGLLPDKTAPLFCNVVVSNLDKLNNNPFNYGVSTFYITLTAAYEDINVLIEAETKHTGNVENCDASNNKLFCISGVMAAVDSTGAGSDVLRRIHANVPLQLNTPPDFGLQSMQSICKLFRVPVTQAGGVPKYDSAAPLDPAVAPTTDCSLPQNSGGSFGAASP